jgi:outer membrane protein assembly factor BamB
MKTLTAILFIAAISLNSLAASWRTDGNGYYPDAKVTPTWSPEENIIWKKKLPNWSDGSPTINGDKIFVCAEPATILCLSKTDGSLLWQAEHPFESFLSAEDKTKAIELAPKIKSLRDRNKKLRTKLWLLKDTPHDEVRKQKEEPLQAEVDKLALELAKVEQLVRPDTNRSHGYSSPTPASDGKNVVVLFGTGVAACHSVDGTKKWSKRIGRPTHRWGHSSSPVIVGNKTIIQITDVLALDTETGKELWRVPGKQVFGSLVHTKVDGKDLIVTAEGKVINADDGKLLAEGLYRLDYCSPVVVDGIAYFIQNDGKAFKLTAEEGVKPQELWTTEPKKGRYYGSPVIHDGLIYTVTHKGEFSVIDTKDGKVLNSTKLTTKGTHYTSPTFAGGYIFIGTEKGHMAVIKAGKKPEVVSVNKLEGLRSSPVFEGTRMYVRCLEHLYCIGE